MKSAAPPATWDRQRIILLLSSFLKQFPSQVRRYLLGHMISDPEYHAYFNLVVSHQDEGYSLTIWFDLKRPLDAVEFLEPSVFEDLRHHIQSCYIMIMSMNEHEVGEDFFLEYENSRLGPLSEIMKLVEEKYHFSCDSISSQLQSLAGRLDPSGYYMVRFCFDGYKLKRFEVAFHICEEFYDQLEADLGKLPREGLKECSKFRGEFSWVLSSNRPPMVRIGRALDVIAPDAVLSGFEKPFYKYFYRATSPSFINELQPFLRSGWITQLYDSKKVVQMNLHIELGPL